MIHPAWYEIRVRNLWLIDEGQGYTFLRDTVTYFYAFFSHAPPLPSTFNWGRANQLSLIIKAKILEIGLDKGGEATQINTA